jgi:hypothetical protein
MSRRRMTQRDMKNLDTLIRGVVRMKVGREHRENVDSVAAQLRPKVVRFGRTIAKDPDPIARYIAEKFVGTLDEIWAIGEASPQMQGWIDELIQMAVERLKERRKERAA